ncbi:hypothetical protein D3C71_1448720 [compost metagenome]
MRYGSSISTTLASVGFDTCQIFQISQASMLLSSVHCVRAMALLAASGKTRLARKARTVSISPSRPATSSHSPVWPAPDTAITLTPGFSRSLKPLMPFGLPGRTRIADGRRYSVRASRRSNTPGRALAKPLIMFSAPLNSTSASCLALSAQAGVGPAVTLTVMPCVLPNAAAASFMAGAGPPGPYTFKPGAAHAGAAARQAKASMPPANVLNDFISFTLIQVSSIGADMRRTYGIDAAARANIPLVLTVTRCRMRCGL